MASLYDEALTCAGRLIARKGAWDRLIDHANDCEPGHGDCDDDAPLVLAPLAVTGRLRIGHITDLADESAPVWVEGRAIVQPGAARTVDDRRRSSVARAEIGRFDNGTLMITGHQAGCTWLASMLRSNWSMR